MKVLKILLIIIGLLVLLVAGLYFYILYKSSHVEDKKNLEANIDHHANQYVAEGNAYALVIGVMKQGKVFFKGYGTTSPGQTTLPDSNTVFELASTSKLFTTSTLQLLADEGVLKINDRIQTILGDKITLPTIATNTTLQHLATHLSGFPSLPNAMLAKMKNENNPYKDLVTQDIYDYLKTCEGKKQDGTFEYSNFGMGLLGHLLALKTGIAYEQLVKEKLLNPLGMSQTFVSIDSSNKSKIVQGYDENGNPSPIWEDHVLTGAGSFLSNGKDMLKFISANLNEDKSAISKTLLASQQQQLGGETGLGWILPSSTDKLLGNQNIVWHNGMAGAYASFVAVDNTNHFGLFILSNKAVDITKLGMKLTTQVRTQSWKASGDQ